VYGRTAKYQADQDRVAAQAQTEAEARRQAKLAAGFNPQDSIIEQIRSHLDLGALLLSHGYARAGSRYRHRNSSSGSFGSNRAGAIKELTERLGLSKAEGRKAVAKTIYNAIRHRKPQQEIERTAFAEGQRHKLSPAEVVRVAQWIVSQATHRRAA
jgi:hypothetical protein